MDIRFGLGSERTWTALLFTLLVFSVGAAPASAFDATLNVTPSTTQAGGHPNLVVQIDRTGTDDEDIRDLYLDLPPGLIGNTTTVGACTEADFNGDTCPANSEVGTVSADAVATGLTLPPTTGTVYNLVPDPDEPGAIGIVLRPMGAPLTFAPVFIRGSIDVVPNGPNDVNLQNIVLNQPRQVFLLPILGSPIPVDITVNSLTLTLNAAGTLAPNTYFLTNPTSCLPATAKARVVSYLDQEVNRESSYTPTNCEGVPFDPFFSIGVDPNTAGANTAPITGAGTPADQHPLSQSHIKTTSILFPYSDILLDFYIAGQLALCEDVDLANFNCRSDVTLGTVTATVPVIDPPTFTGHLYRTRHPEIAIFTVAAVLEGPRGVKTVVHGYSEFQPYGMAFIFPSQPQVPITELEVAIGPSKFYINRTHCGTKKVSADFIAHSAATAHVTDTFKTSGNACEYARPKAATPTKVALVPAFKQCTSSNATHGAPLAVPSCSPAVPSSSYLTVGSPEGNGNPASSAGNVKLKTVGESPIDPENGDQADIEITADLSDVRNQGSLSDYTGELRGVLQLRVTDRYNIDNNGWEGGTLDSSATVNDTTLGFSIGCTATAGPEGADCNVTTSADAVMTDIVREGQRGTWRLGQVQVFDGGADGDADTTGDNTLFAVQGTFLP